MKARKIKYDDAFAFERGLEARGYSSDSERIYRGNWHGIPFETSIWTKHGRGNPQEMLLFRLGNEFRLYKQTDIGRIFDGDEDVAEILE